MSNEYTPIVADALYEFATTRTNIRKALSQRSDRIKYLTQVLADLDEERGSGQEIQLQTELMHLRFTLALSSGHSPKLVKKTNDEIDHRQALATLSENKLLETGRPTDMRRKSLRLAKKGKKVLKLGN